MLRALRGPRLDDALAQAFAEEVAATNQRRQRVILPLVGVGQSPEAR